MDGRGSGDAPTSADAGSGQCIGQALSNCDIQNTSTCYDQGGDWANSCVVYCGCVLNGQGHICEWYTAFHDPQGCLKRMGCAWRSADGTVAVSPAVSGTCIGTPQPCSLYDAGCNQLQGCVDPGDGTCQAGSAVITDCSDFEKDIASFQFDGEIAKNACQNTRGCTWKDGNGTPPAGYVSPGDPSQFRPSPFDGGSSGTGCQ